MKKENSKNMNEKLILVVASGLLVCITLILFEKVNEIQPSPYIDEIFHIPQAQLFCKNIWSEVCHLDNKLLWMKRISLI